MKVDHEKKGKITFANVVISVCVVVALLVTLAVLWEYHRLGTVIPSGVISALFAFWGGELLIVALRQVFGSDVIRKTPFYYSKDTQEADIQQDNSDIFGGSI